MPQPSLTGYLRQKWAFGSFVDKLMSSDTSFSTIRPPSQTPLVGRFATSFTTSINGIRSHRSKSCAYEQGLRAAKGSCQSRRLLRDRLTSALKLSGGKGTLLGNWLAEWRT